MEGRASPKLGACAETRPLKGIGQASIVPVQGSHLHHISQRFVDVNKGVLVRNFSRGVDLNFRAWLGNVR